MKEATIQKGIITLIHSLGGWTVKTIASNKRGVPDVLACIDGRFVAIEVKRPGGKVSALQDYQIKKIADAGGEAHVCYSVDDAKRVLDVIGITH